MTTKRFENRLNKNNIKFNTQNPVWDNEKQDAFNVFEMIDLLNELYEENEQLKKENQMLKHTIGRNESYITRITHKGEWKDTSKPMYRSISRGDLMTEKRFTIDKKGGTYYLFDHGNLITISDGQPICDLLNELHEENTYLKLELDTHKHPLWSTREAERKVSELTELLADEVKRNGKLLEEINLLRIENMRLKEVQKYE